MYNAKISGPVRATVPCPRSKGYTNRALVVAALAEGTSILSNVLLSDDTQHMMRGLQAFGAAITVEGTTAVVTGINGKPRTPTAPIFTGNSGTTARFLAAVASLSGEATIDGDARMRERPIRDLADALTASGASITTTAGCPPVHIRGGTLQGGAITMKGKTSSQFLSALLMVCPYAEKDTHITIADELTSKPFADMTLQVMRDFGAEAKHSNYRTFAVKSGKQYRARAYFVEGDAANASYFLAAAAVTKGVVKVTGINPGSLQGEIRFADLLQRMGCTVRKGNDWIEIRGNTLHGVTADMNAMPDVVQTLAVVAAFASTPTTITNVKNLRIKETDRIAALAAELRKIGAAVDERDDCLVITPGKLHGADIKTYNDHRMAMSFAAAGLAVADIRIENPGCVAKTFPDFFAWWEKL